MKRKDLEDYLTDYIQANPRFTDDEFMQVIKQARKNAILASIPEYKPLEVADKKEIFVEFEERRKKAIRKSYRDESTNDF
ncbi:hypothetical protein ACTPGW_002613 [Enterococcus faecalis]